MVRLRVLGPIEAEVDGHPVDPGGPRQRAVLALLLVGHGEVVSVDRMIEQLWRGEPPPRAIASLQAYVSNLRRLLEPARAQRTPATLLVSRAPGYALRLPTEAVDAWRFEELLREAQRRSADEPDRAHELVSEGLALWHGPAYAEVADEEWAAAEAARLAELRVVGRELAVDLAVRLGRAAEAVPAAELLTREHPLREEGWRLLALSLWATGRQADALAALRKARGTLNDELGLDPGPALTALEDAILHQRTDVIAAPPQTRAARAAEEQVDGAFVGRRPELDRLAELAARARITGGVALLTGEAGLGKSSLLTRVRGQLIADGWTVAVGRCPETDGAPSAWAWVEALGQLAERHPPADAEALAALLRATAPAVTDAAAGRFRLHRAVLDWLRTAARREPLAVLLDDLHRADGETLTLLEQAARELDGVPVLLMAAYRPADGGERLDEALAQLARREPERVALTGLAASEVGSLVAAVHGHPLDGETVRALADRTGGNPFYVRESARLLRSEGALVALAEVPEGVRDVLRRRLARLPQPAVSVLRLAAVVGREAEVDVLLAAADADEDTVLDALETGVVAGLLGEPGPGRIRFAHALVRDTLYGDLTRLRRSRMHGRVAAVIRELHPDDLSALAYHYALTAGADDLAVDYGIRAAEQAERRYAHDAAVGLLKRALDRLPDTEDREDRRSDLLGRLLRAHLRCGALTAARQTRQRALDAARAAGRDDLVIAAFTAWSEPTPWQARQYGVVDQPVVDALTSLLKRTDLDAETRIRLLDSLVAELAGEDDPRILAAADEAIELARAAGDPQVLAFALATGVKATQVDALTDRRLELAVELARLAEGLELPAFHWYAVYAIAAAAGARGDLPELHRRLAQAQDLARRFRMIEAEAIHSFADARLLHIAGRLDESEQVYLAAADRLGRAGSVHAAGFLVIALTTLRLDQGRIAEMEPTMRELIKQYRDAGDALALALAAQGRIAEARAAR
ncbi:BTAD domain-containing putative transcriptional regulator, partial [Actinoplanes sp. NPDC051633]|uniref:ATP-binding protein n=1 Tax=Actinoplanes sp. NPDC051633 TaxID=3155670 RepID=UPI003424A5EC